MRTRVGQPELWAIVHTLIQAAHGTAVIQLAESHGEGIVCPLSEDGRIEPQELVHAMRYVLESELTHRSDTIPTDMVNLQMDLTQGWEMSLKESGMTPDRYNAVISEACQKCQHKKEAEAIQAENPEIRINHVDSELHAVLSCAWIPQSAIRNECIDKVRGQAAVESFNMLAEKLREGLGDSCAASGIPLGVVLDEALP